MPDQLYRMEYVSFAPLGQRRGRKTILVPLSDAGDREKLSKVLRVVSRCTDDLDGFLIEKFGGHVDHTFYLGQQVEVIDGPYKGERFYLRDRTGSEGNWWLARSPDGDAFLGLNQSYFRPVGEKD